MKKFHAVCLLLACAVFGASLTAQAAMPSDAGTGAHAGQAAKADAQAAIERVQDLSAALLKAMKGAEALGFMGRRDMLAPVLRATYNFPLMTRLATGPAWRKATEEQRQQLTEAFTDFSVSTYAARFKGWSGEKFQITGTHPDEATGGLMVETDLIKSNGEKVALHYLLRNDDEGAPRIVDVFLDAAISEMATRRAEFSAIARKEGIPALIAHLEKKIRSLQAPTG